MVYVIIIIANYFLHMNYQTMHCSKQTHIKGFCTSMTFGFKTLSYHHVNTYPGPIFSIKRKAGIFLATNGKFNLDEMTLTLL